MSLAIVLAGFHVTGAPSRVTSPLTGVYCVKPVLAAKRNAFRTVAPGFLCTLSGAPAGSLVPIASTDSEMSPESLKKGRSGSPALAVAEDALVALGNPGVDGAAADPSVTHDAMTKETPPSAMRRV